ncbi:MAG: cation diffusion facilitator family transporter [Syntrophomonadaceae bacterium]
MGVVTWYREVMANPKARVEALAICSNTLLVIGKLITGMITGSVGIIAEAIHSTIDMVSSVIAFTSVRISGLPADKEHKFGHGKAENIAGSVEAVLIFVAAVMILDQAVKRIINGGAVENAVLGVIVMAVATVVNIIVSQILLTQGSKLESIALEADGMHLRADVYTSVGVLVGMVAIWVTGFDILDPLIAIVVGLIIIHAAYEIFVKSFRPLMDASLSDEEEEEIAHAVEKANIEGLVGFHDLRTRRSGSERYVDMHLVVRSGLSIDEVHLICDQVEEKIYQSLPHVNVLVHAEPCEEKDCVACKGCQERTARPGN